MNLSSGRSRWRTEKAVYVAYAHALEPVDYDYGGYSLRHRLYSC